MRALCYNCGRRPVMLAYSLYCDRCAHGRLLAADGSCLHCAIEDEAADYEPLIAKVRADERGSGSRRPLRRLSLST